MNDQPEDENKTFHNIFHHLHGVVFQKSVLYIIPVVSKLTSKFSATDNNISNICLQFYMITTEVISKELTTVTGKNTVLEGVTP